MVGCACNSRLNLVRLFVNPPHPTRLRTPPWGVRVRPSAHLCARPVVLPRIPRIPRLRLCACVRLCLLVHARLSTPACLCTCMHRRSLALAPGYLPACICLCLCAPGSPLCWRCMLAPLACFARSACAPCACSGFPLATLTYAGHSPPSLMPGGSLSAVLAAARPSLLSW